MQRLHPYFSLLGCAAFLSLPLAFGQNASSSAGSSVVVVGTPMPANDGPATSPPASTPTTPVDPDVIVAPAGGDDAHLLVNDPAWAVTELRPSDNGEAMAARLVNVSVRAPMSTGAGTLIAGAAVRGSGTVPVLARAIGPGLRKFGVTNAATFAPELTIYRSGEIAAQTNIMAAGVRTAEARVGAFPAMANSGTSANGDAALLGQIAAGDVTAHCTSWLSGVGMLEFYDAGSGAAASAAHFVNFSARTLAGSGDRTMVVGFVISGEGSVTLLLRGIGATLEAFGVTGTMVDPAIELYAGNSIIARNDNWQSQDGGAIQAAADSVGAFALTSTKDAAMLVSLRAGTYTLHVHAAGNASADSGVALAEIYEVPAAGTFDAAGAANAIGLDIYRQLTATPSDGNLIISPYSVETAFALACAGAAGETRAEMARVLRLPSDNLPLVTGMNALRDTLTKIASDSAAVAQARSGNGVNVEPIQWQVGNRVFGQIGCPFRESYLTLMADGFDAPLQQLNFAQAPDASRVTINNWVADVTHDRIQDLIPAGGIDEMTRFVLVNALYLKAPWNAPFAKGATALQPFHLADGSSPAVPTMADTTYLGYATGNGYAVATVQYIGEGLQFVIILPDATESVASIAARLTPADVAGWTKLANSNSTYVALSLPKFTIASPSFSLADTLTALGMKSAFGVGGPANFDGIAPRDTYYLQLQNVYHKTFVAVDEEGTEAAAATAVTGGTTGIIEMPTPVEFRVDRPFLFAIQERTTGALLFFGRVTDPR